MDRNGGDAAKLQYLGQKVAEYGELKNFAEAETKGKYTL